MTATWMPGALRKEISKHNVRLASAHNRINYHVAVSEATSLYGFFSGAGVCSHFYVRKDGTIEQYIAVDFRSGADLEGNDATVSVETQGGVSNAQGEPWTDAQVVSLAKIALWVHQVYPQIPLRLATSSKIGDGSKGLSWHRLGVDGSFPALPSILAGRLQRGGGMRYSNSAGKICPGDAKISQMPNILAVAQGGVVEVENPIVVPPVGNGGGVKNWLQQGDTGAEVSELQRLLKARGYNLDVDGSFGPATLAAVRSFQMVANLVIDGLAGPATLSALRAAPSVPAQRVLSKGDTGEDVRALQQTLRSKGYALDADGSFGRITENVVKAFQKAQGLSVDGIVGPQTQAALARPTAPQPVTNVAATVTALRRGSSGPAVRTLQATLKRDYPAYASKIVVDGLFGPATEAAVKEFQRRSNLTVDGIVGPQTRAALGL